MRTLACLLAASATITQPPIAGNPTEAGRRENPMRIIGTMSDLMVKMIYPTSDAVFYIETRTPKTDEEWAELQAKTLTLAEAANLLMMPGRARDQERWIADATLMLDAGAAAYKAAKAKDVAALVAVNDDLYQSCVVCHQHYRRNYGRGRGHPLP